MAEVFSELLDGDASGQHNAGVVMTELVDAFLAGGDVTVAAAPVLGRFGDHASLDQGRLPDGLGVTASFDMLSVCGPAEQDAGRVWFPARLFPRKGVRPGRVFLDMPSDGLDIPIR
jgi:hypothetical protein